MEVVAKKRYYLISIIITIVCVFGIIVYSCRASDSQKIQITSAFTPGSTKAVVNRPQLPGSITSSTETALSTSQSVMDISSIPTMIITNSMGQAVLVTKTMAPNYLSQPTNTRTPQPATQNPYPIASVTTTLFAPPTSTQPPALPEGWEGEWTVYYERPGSGVIKTTLLITLDGTNLNATMAIDNGQYVYTGYIFNEGVYATGLWSGGGSDGSFWWNLDSTGHFRGCHQNKFAFCGTRDGVSQPSPCLQIPTS